MTASRNHALAALLLCAISILAYSATLHNGFVWDDNFQIVRNPFLHSDHPWKTLLTSDVWGYIRAGSVSMSNYYRPLQMLTYRITAERAGLEPAAFHFVNLLFNVLATLGAYAVIWKLTNRFGLALAASTLFAAHPEHSEAVVWIAGLTELGCAFFYFLSFWLFLLAGDNDGRNQSRGKDAAPAKRRLWLVLASCISFFCALLWKEMALTLPAVIAAYVFFVAENGSDPDKTLTRRLREAALKSLPYWTVTALYVGVRFAVLGYFSRVQHEWPLSPLAYVLSTIELMGQYWLKLLLPTGLSAFHVFHPAQSPLEFRAIAALLFLVVAISAMLWGMRRAPLPTFAAAWVFLTLIPVLNLRGVGENVFAERYLYIPSLGFVLLVVWLADRVMSLVPPPAARVAAITAVVLIAGLGIAQTRRRVPDWKDDFTLYERSVEIAPDAALMRNSLAQLLRDQKGDLDGAEREYRAGLRAATNQDPPNKLQMANSYVGLAGIYTRRGQYQEALQFVDQGLALDSTLPTLYVARGIILLHLGRAAEAEDVLTQAHGYFPYDEVVLNGLGVIALERKQYDKAIDYFQKEVNVVPNNPDAVNNLAHAYSAAGKLAEAIPVFQRASELNPNNPEVFNDLGRAYGGAGRWSEALPPLQRAVELAPLAPHDPTAAKLHTNLGVVLSRLGRSTEARAEFERALAIVPNFPPAVANLNLVNQSAPQAKAH